MGVNPNSSRSDSESSSNTGKENEELEIMECKPSNSRTFIKRSWIIKKSICLSDEHVMFQFKRGIFLYFNPPSEIKRFDEKYYKKKNINPKVAIFDSGNDWTADFKHWAIILELSNDSFVNIQFGRNGFSLKEFNQTKIKGENILDVIINTWGQKNYPVSFCYLGEANFDYEYFKKILREKKEKEKKFFEINRKAYYNLVSRNCHHFALDIEKILFNKIKKWHSFNFYFKDFFNTFFSNINMDILKLKIIEKENANENEKLGKIIADCLFGIIMLIFINFASGIKNFFFGFIYPFNEDYFNKLLFKSTEEEELSKIELPSAQKFELSLFN